MFGVPQLLDGIDVVIVAVALFALSESLGHLLTGTGHSPSSRCAGPPWLSRSDLAAAPGRPGCAAPRWASRSARCPRAARRSRPSCVHGREEARPRTPRSSARGDRGRRRPGGGQQRRGRRRARAAADARAADVGDGRDHPRRVPALRPAARPAAVHRVGPAGLDADREPVHRQRDAARAEPAARAAVGAAADASRRTASTPGCSCFATLGAYAAGGTTVDLVVLCVLGLLGLR